MNASLGHTLHFFDAATRVAGNGDMLANIARLISDLCELRGRGGRLFILGLGGSAANASHAVNDFRKLCRIDAHAPENLAELTARINDEGWDSCYADWLEGHRLNENDALLILSVGGGASDVSQPLVCAMSYALTAGARIFGIVGRDGGITKRDAHVCVIVPPIEPHLVTPLTESFQSLILHAVVSHPALARGRAKWESLAP